MDMIYAMRALEIFRDEGPIELSKKITRFLFSHPLRLLDPHHHRRFKFQTWKNDLQNEIRHDAPPDPYQPIFIIPKQIQYQKKSDNLHPEKIGLGKIKEGDWDSKDYDKSVDKVARIIYFSERFSQNKNQKGTQRYKQLLNKLNDQKHRYRGFDTAEEFLSEYCTNYDELYKEISENGYIINDNNPRVGPERNYANLRDRLEVLVVIDREGNVYLHDGAHRFGIARVLDLEIPANVLCRHKQWQELRDEIHNNGLPSGHKDLRNHPDLHDVLD